MQALSSKSIVVTGASGFIGRHLTARLVGLGASVRVLVRDRDRAASRLPANVELVEGDVCRVSSVWQAVSEADVVFHLANVVPRPDTRDAAIREVNVFGTQNVVNAAVEAGVERFVHVSSVAVYGFPQDCANEETRYPCIDDDLYVTTKQRAEQIVRSAHAHRRLPATIVQPSEIYGPYDQGWTLIPLRMLKKGKMMLPGGGHGIIQPVFVDDVVDGILLAAENGKTGEGYILSGPSVVTVRQYFERLGELVGAGPMRSVPDWVANGAASVSEVWGSFSGRPPMLTRAALRYISKQGTFAHEKARRELGYRPRVSLDEGTARVRAWLEEEGLIPITS